MGTTQVNLTSINTQVTIFPKGCAFALRRLDCRMEQGGSMEEGEEKPCKPTIIRIGHLKERKGSCDGDEVGKNPGRGKRTRGADKNKMKDLNCEINVSEDSCSVPNSEVPAVCVNASVFIDDNTFITTNIYVAKDNGTYDFGDDTFDIHERQVKFTVAYSGETCCPYQNLDCYCEDLGEDNNVTLDFGLTFVKPGRPQRRNQNNQGGQGGQGARDKSTTYDMGDAQLEVVNEVITEVGVVPLEENDITITEQANGDAELRLCIPNITSYFIWDPIVQASATVEDQDDQNSLNTLIQEYGEEVQDDESDANTLTLSLVPCALVLLSAALLQ